ncbi:MAG: universal stress protein [Bacteroidota bacterium]|jgi:nucleotide-binding universal stress UspA family protein|nr:universal stress protein [Bacteroidota bacterium]
MKILVTSDFSPNSKAAIRFVQSLVKHSKNIELVFYHAVQIMKPTLWSNVYFNQYKTDEIERLTKELKKFTNTVIGKDKVKFVAINYVVDDATDTEKDIIKYAEKNKMDFICIATQGAGILRKIVGTHTSYIVNNSTVPIFVIPSYYRAKSIKNITFLSDFENLKNELTKISKFTKEHPAQLEVLHYATVTIDEKKRLKNKELLAKEMFKLNIQKNKLDRSLVDRIGTYVKKHKPELLIMFTNREKSFFEKIFLPSKSAELTYSTKVPVLIYSK